MNIRKLTLSSLLVAIGVIGGHIIYIPIGISKVFPVQHGINLLMGVLFGPWSGVAVAFVIPFILSSLVGAIAGYILLKVILKTKIIDKYNMNGN